MLGQQEVDYFELKSKNSEKSYTITGTLYNNKQEQMDRLFNVYINK